MILEELEVLIVNPGQLLVVKVDTFLNENMRKRIQELILINAPMLKDRFLVIDKSVTLSVVDIDAS